MIWSKIGWMAPHAHNGYRETLLNFGVMGALVMASMLFTSTYFTFRDCFTPTEEDAAEDPSTTP